MTTLNYTQLLHANTQKFFGVSGTFTLLNSTSFALSVLDKTSGVEVDQSGGQLPTIKPAAAIRMYDLLQLGHVPSDLQNADLLMNSVHWTIVSYFPKPSPNGEADGELYLILEEV